MFSSNQLLEISGDLDHENDLRDAIEFVLKKSGWYECFTRREEPVSCAFQITETGAFCIGTGSFRGEKEKDWTDFQFDFDVDIIAKIVEQHLRKQDTPNEFFGGDGSSSKGFLISQIDYQTESVNNFSRGIIIIHPYRCYYAK